MSTEFQPLVQIEDLSFRRGEHLIFDGLNVVVPRGQVAAIMGPSGTGKTTLLKLIGGLLRPSGGRILVDGEDVHRLSRHDLYRVRRKMGMLFQSSALLTDLDVFENVAFPLREGTRLPEGVLRALVLMVLQAVGLRGARRLMPSELSGGMERRVALARAIVMDPVMIMYDEPFTGLDPITLGAILSLIKRLNEGLGLSSIVVSHDVPETLSIADRVYVISGGKVVAEGSPDALRENTSPWVRQFLDGQADGPVPFHYPAPDYAEELLGSG